jgi:tetratricopeptide (TPR) repeat protein
MNMINKYKGLITGFILPAAAVIIASMVNKWLGIGVLAVYLLVFVYISRASIYTLIGTRSYGLGKMDDAIKWFGKAYATNRASIRTSASYVYLLLKNRELDKADEILQKIMGKNIQSQDLPYIKSIKALVLWKKGELDNAAAILEEVIQTYKTTSVYGSLGCMLILQGDLEKALQFNLEAYDYNSSDNIINDNLGQNYYLLGMYDKAGEVYEKLIAKAPTFPEPYYNYGLLLEKQESFDKALEMMRKAMDQKFTYLSTITKEDVEAAIKRLESIAGNQEQ